MISYNLATFTSFIRTVVLHTRVSHVNNNDVCHFVCLSAGYDVHNCDKQMTKKKDKDDDDDVVVDDDDKTLAAKQYD